MQIRNVAVCAAVVVSFIASSCAYNGVDQEPLGLVRRVMTEACIPYVVEAVDADGVGQRLGGSWHRNLPDPFSPPLGPTFRRGSATVQVVDGRRFRGQDGNPTRTPLRSCNLWLSPQNEGLLIDAVASAVRLRPNAVLVEPAIIDENLRIIGCISLPSENTAVVSALIHDNGTVGAGVIERRVRPAFCAP